MGARSDEFKKYYWIGRWCDAVRLLKGTDQALHDAVMYGASHGSAIHWQQESDRLRKETEAALNNARKYGAIITT